MQTLCQDYNLDVSFLKTKEARISALQTIPNLQNVTLYIGKSSNTNGTPVNWKGSHVLSLGVMQRLLCNHANCS